MPTVNDVISAVRAHYPLHLVQEWDRVGLVCGEAVAPVRRILLTVDVTPATVDEAIRIGADMMVAHHPLLLRGAHSVATTDPKGAMLHKLIRAGAHGIALYVAHTNADAATHGVSHALADALGLRNQRPLLSSPAQLDQLTVFVPTAEDGSAADPVAAVVDAVSAAIGPVWGDYTRCAWWSQGTGTFTPGEASHPTIGRVGEPAYVDEVRVEITVPRARRHQAVDAMRSAHPYEVPAFSVVELANADDGQGLGRIGELEHAMPFEEFVAQVASSLPKTQAGVRGAGDRGRIIRSVAVCGGAGDSLLSTVAAANVDAYVTADLRHHPVNEFVERHHTALVDAGHWATERPWLDKAATILRTDLGATVEIIASDIVTDPWSVVLPSASGENS